MVLCIITTFCQKPSSHRPKSIILEISPIRILFHKRHSILLQQFRPDDARNPPLEPKQETIHFSLLAGYNVRSYAQHIFFQSFSDSFGYKLWYNCFTSFVIVEICEDAKKRSVKGIDKK